MTASLTGTPAATLSRDGWTDAGIILVGLAAAATSWAGWVGLGESCGFTGHAELPLLGWSVHLSWLLPVAVDVYALTASRVWLRVPGLSSRTRTYARTNALGAVAVSIAGNAVYHWLAAQGPHAKPDVWLIVGVASIAPLMLGLVGHLSALVAEDRHSRTAPATHSPGTHDEQAESAPTDPTPPETDTEPAPGLPPVVDTMPSATGRDATTRMRRFWDSERATGRTPSAAQLEKAAIVPLSDGYARRKRRQWLAAEN